jgi:hypothetical protein
MEHSLGKTWLTANRHGGTSSEQHDGMTPTARQAVFS